MTRRKTEPNHETCDGMKDFVTALQAACARAGEADLCGPCMVAGLVHAAALIIAMNFQEDRVEGLRVARQCSTDLRMAARDYLSEVAPSVH